MGSVRGSRSHRGSVRTLAGVFGWRLLWAQATHLRVGRLSCLLKLFKPFGGFLGALVGGKHLALRLLVLSVSVVLLPQCSPQGFGWVHGSNGIRLSSRW